VASVGSRSGVTYDARGLVEPFAELPDTIEVDGARARFDAADLTIRQINMALRHLIYHRGIGEVTVLNPASKHSLAVGILKRCRIHFEGSPGWFACGLIDGPEATINGRAGWSVAEHMMAGVVTAKLFANDAAIRATDRAMRIVGGQAITHALPLERYYRDVRGGLTHPPSGDLALEFVGRDAIDKFGGTGGD